MASETRDVNPRPSPRRVARKAAATSQASEPDPDDPLLRRDRDGRRVRRDALRVPARDPEPARVLAREAARRRPPATGWSSAIRTPWPTRFARPDVIRLTPGARLADQLVADLRARRAAPRAVTAPSATRASVVRRPQATATATTMPAASATKLDCENEMSSPSHVAHDDGVQAGDAPAADAAEQDPRERGEDRDREVAPVHRRVPEHRVDPEERRVRVEHLDARVPEHVAGHPLVRRRPRRTRAPSRRGRPRATSATGRARAAVRSRSRAARTAGRTRRGRSRRGGRRRVQTIESPVQTTNAASGRATGPSSRARSSPRTTPTRAKARARRSRRRAGAGG